MTMNRISRASRLLLYCGLMVTVWCAASERSSAGEFPGREWTSLVSPEVGGWSSERLAEAREVSRGLDTAAVVIVYQGTIVDQWGSVALPLRCHSVRKSILSALYGRHVEAGTIRRGATLQELKIDDNAPSLTEVERRARVIDLLQARSGIYHSALYETPGMKARRPKRGSHAPGTFWYYNNWDFNVLGTIFEQQVGRGLFDEFEEVLARPLQFQDFVRQRHTSYFRGEDSLHPAYPFELSARDLARFGLLMLHEGNWRGEQLVPRDWVGESTTSYSDVGAAGGYGYMWWVAVDGRHFPGVTLPLGSYSARGNRGQYLVVIPAWQIVVAHRVNTFQDETEVNAEQFGRLLQLILAARPSESANEQVAAVPPTKHDFDLILSQGTVIDGTGRAAFVADVGVRAGRIAVIGELDENLATKVIEAKDRIVAPGFIDLHSHADDGLVSDDPQRRAAPNLITQGVTTVVVNQDGDGPASIAEQRKTMTERGVGIHVVQMIGHGQVRRAAMGSDFRHEASPEQVARMVQLIEQGMQEGALGLSAGLEYVPGRWSSASEMKTLVASLKPFDGVFVVHERSSGTRPMWYWPSRDPAAQPSMIDNLQEQIDIAEATGVTVVATHIKARGVDFWGSSRVMIDMLERARSRGVPIFADQYAYNTSGSDGRITLVPDWIKAALAESKDAQADAANETSRGALLERALADEKLADKVRRDIEYEIIRRGGAEHIVVVDHPQEQSIGKSLAELAKEESSTPVEMAIRLQVRDHARLRAFSMSEEDVERFAAVPWIATSSDAGIAVPHDPPVHPRFYGAFPRKIRRYALDRGLLSLEEAVRVSSALPASILKLADRGTLVVGAHADIVVFDPRRIRDRADAFKPHQYCEGVEFVFLDGQMVVEREACLGNLVGTVITREARDGARTKADVVLPAANN